MTTPARRDTGHRYSVKSRTTEGFPLSRSEVERFCKRLRNMADPIVSHETWAAAFFGAGVALAVAYFTFPDSTKHAGQHGLLLGLTIACGVFFVALISLAVAERKRRKNDAWYVADDLEGICDERMGPKK